MRGFATPLTRFANALREVLGLDPLPTDGVKQVKTDLERFYIHPWEDPVANPSRTPRPR